MTEENKFSGDGPESSDRRAFLTKASRFAVATPAAVTVLLSTSMQADAGVMKSVGDKYKNGHGNGDGRKRARKHIRKKLYRMHSRLMGGS